VADSVRKICGAGEDVVSLLMGTPPPLPTSTARSVCFSQEVPCEDDLPRGALVSFPLVWNFGLSFSLEETSDVEAGPPGDLEGPW